MKKVYIMNSSMMPQDGFYSRSSISAEQFVVEFKAADEIISSVAYPELIELMFKELGILIPLDWEKRTTNLQEDQCDILVVKLKYRIPSERKGHRLGSSIDDYEFLKVKYYREI